MTVLAPYRFTCCQSNTEPTPSAGGASELEYTTHGLYSSGLDGCVAEVTVAPDHVIDLTSADDGRQVGYCL